MDIATGFAIGQLLRTKGYLLRSIKHVHNNITSAGNTLTTIRCDSEFITTEIQEYCDSFTFPILLKGCIPYEHDTLPFIERLHKTIRESVVKALAFKPHINDKYWGMAYHDAIMKYNITPPHRNPTTTPYELWHGEKYDILNNPLLPFGTIIMAHLPLSEQTTLSGRAFISYYVGCAPNYRGGILLYNPATQRTIIRRSYKVIGDKLEQPMNYKLHSPPPDLEEIYHDNQYGTDDAFDYDPSEVPPTKHQAITPEKIPDEEYVVERILGHKGNHTRPSSMKFLVKWLGFDHSHNSWLPWTSTNELAAMDTYEQNNPDVQFPATKTYNMFEVNNTGQFHMKMYNTINTIYPTIDKSSALIPHSVVQAQQSTLSKYWTKAQ